MSFFMNSLRVMENSSYRRSSYRSSTVLLNYADISTRYPSDLQIQSFYSWNCG
jgi:hypothetical protein